MQHQESKQAKCPSPPEHRRPNLSYAAKPSTRQTYNHSCKGGSFTVPCSTSEVANSNPCVDENFDPIAGEMISDGELLHIAICLVHLHSRQLI